MEELSQFMSLGVGTHRRTCPKCSPHRKNKKDRCLSITVTQTEIKGCCHHCGNKFVMTKDFNYDKYQKKKDKISEFRNQFKRYL